jgi:branched-chain amino acid transport system ATP-binding protein
MNLLILSDVSVSFGGLKAVDSLNMNLEVGEIHGLIGPNGSGKSTTLNAISGLYRPSSGSIKIFDKELIGCPPHKIKIFGLARTFQHCRIFSGLSVIENVLIGGHTASKMEFYDFFWRWKKIKAEESFLREKALKVIYDVGLAGKEEIVCGSLPYGMRRLVEIGRALMDKPKLIMLDEPTVGMTADEIQNVKRIVLENRKQNITTLVISHDMKTIMSLCDKITVLNYGKKIAEGTAQNIKNNSSVIEAYLGAGNDNA